jgi:hypothetical protein
VNIHTNCVNILFAFKVAVTEYFKSGKELRLCMGDEFNVGGISVDTNSMFFEEI